MLQCSYHWQNLKQWTQWRLFCVWKGLLALDRPQNCIGLVTNILPTMLVHYPTLSGFWIGWEGQNVSTGLSVPSTGHACSVKMALVKLDPWGFLMLFSICLHGRPYLHGAGRHTAERSLWITLTSVRPCKLRVWCLFVCVRVCLCVHICRGAHAFGLLCEAAVFNPLICWTLEITAVICQLGRSDYRVRRRRTSTHKLPQW